MTQKFNSEYKSDPPIEGQVALFIHREGVIIEDGM